MHNIGYLFLSKSDLPSLKQGWLHFYDWDQQNDPFLNNFHIYKPVETSQPMSDQEFSSALRDHYDAMDESMRNLVTWAFYLEQANKNRASLEQQIQKPKEKTSSLIPTLKQYAGVCWLNLYRAVDSDVLWQLYGSDRQGFAVEFDLDHPYFTNGKYGEHPQIFGAITYDDTRPNKPSKSEPFPALFKQPKIRQFEQSQRLVRPKAARDKASNLFKLPKEALKGFYVGAFALDSIEQSLLQLVSLDLNFRHIPVFRMGVSPDYLRLVAIPR